MAAPPAIRTDAGMAGRQARPELTRCTERLSPLGLAAALASADPPLLLDVRTPQNGTGEPWSDLRCPVIFFLLASDYASWYAGGSLQTRY